MVLTLDAALDGCGAGLVVDGVVVAERRHEGRRGSAAALPAMAAAVLREAAVGAGALSAVAVTVGPGSFTGVRAGLALAHGIGAAVGVPVLGVSVGAAVRAVVEGEAGRAVWVAVDTRRGRVFLDVTGTVAAVGLDELPAPMGAVAVAGDAAEVVADRLVGRGFDVRLLRGVEVEALGIARAAAWPVEAQPLYVDGPEARPKLGGRPAPV